MCNTMQKNYSVNSTSTTNSLTPLNTTLPIEHIELQGTKTLSPAGKEYLCFQINRRSPHATKCFKSRILNKVIDYILSIDTFEQRRVVIKGMLQLPRLEDHMKYWY